MTCPTGPTPRVSVCVPTYNGAPYLRECLASIQAQTLGDFEVVIADDASTDATCAIAAEFVERDPRFRLHRNPAQLGLVGNWMRCIQASRGTWIKLLFQDDLLKENCLARLVESCERSNRPFGFCEREILFDGLVADTTQRMFRDHQSFIEDQYRNKESVDAATFARMCAEKSGANLIGEPTVTLFHQSVFRAYGGFNPALIQICDQEFWARVGSNTGVVHVAEKLAAFRVHGGSATARNQSSREYHKSKLDPLILRYVLLRHPQCQNIRAAMYARFGRRTVWSWCLGSA